VEYVKNSPKVEYVKNSPKLSAACWRLSMYCCCIKPRRVCVACPSRGKEVAIEKSVEGEGDESDEDREG